VIVYSSRIPSEAALTHLFEELYARLVLRSVPPKAGLPAFVAIGYYGGVDTTQSSIRKNLNEREK